MREPEPWDKVFMSLAVDIAKRSKDPNTQVGAVIVTRDNRIRSLGYNGPPRGMYDANVPWDKRPDKYDWIIHAEENAWLFALEQGSIDGCRIYTSGFPCSRCTLRLAHLGVRDVVYGTIQPLICDEVDRELTERIMDAMRMQCYGVTL